MGKKEAITHNECNTKGMLWGGKGGDTREHGGEKIGRKRGSEGRTEGSTRERINIEARLYKKKKQGHEGLSSSHAKENCRKEKNIRLVLNMDFLKAPENGGGRRK